MTTHPSKPIWTTHHLQYDALEMTKTIERAFADFQHKLSLIANASRDEIESLLGISGTLGIFQVFIKNFSGKYKSNQEVCDMGEVVQGELQIHLDDVRTELNKSIDTKKPKELERGDS